MESPQTIIEQALGTCPALTCDELKEILDYLIGRTQRSVSDAQIKQAFEQAHKNWIK